MKFCKVISAAIAACVMAVTVGMSAGASITPVETNFDDTDGGSNGAIRAQTQVYKGYDYAPYSGVSVYSYGAKLSILDIDT